MKRLCLCDPSVWLTGNESHKTNSCLSLRVLKEWTSNLPQSSGILSVTRSSLGVMIYVSRSVNYHHFFLCVCVIQLFSIATSAIYLYILFRCLIKCRGQKYLRNKFLYIELFTLCTYWQEFQKESGELRTGMAPLSPRHCLSRVQNNFSAFSLDL